MNNRHIQTFLTVSAAFFAMSAPLPSNARTQSGAKANTPCVQCVTNAPAETNVLPAAKAARN
ncbi:hypothetical protein [Paraburkholderia sp. J41]|uniref:hypothetical protein n=1 Tax=Paraburkholderia sp. J41 TaxID=2805433 RepID=UPI002AC31A88|nr:hypothetical protein [Paraburkholderia sp. J41]